MLAVINGAEGELGEEGKERRECCQSSEVEGEKKAGWGQGATGKRELEAPIPNM
jgi:hypothetical protein